MIRVDVKPELWHWVVERSGDRAEGLRERFPKLEEWVAGSSQPTLKQLEDFARAAHVSVGFLFLDEPPAEAVPIPDLRTIGSQGVQRPSPDMLDTIYLCQQRQAWYQDYAERVGESRRTFVGSVAINDSPKVVADKMRTLLQFRVAERRQFSSWIEALRQFIQQAEEIGVLVMISGVVGANNTRPLDPDEFRGFALADQRAPLVFVNGADTKAAQMFTLAHELAHLWLGESALTNTGPASTPAGKVEVWCNQVAAELLVPLEDLRTELGNQDALTAVVALARNYKVSTLVVLRRLLDAKRLSRERFDKAYIAELRRLKEEPKSGGGNYYLTQSARFGRRFARAVIVSTLEGQTLYRDAFKMLGIKKGETFRQLGENIGVLS